MPVPETEVVIQIEGAEAARHLLRPGEYVLGRAEDADLRVEAELVSRRHALLTINYDHALIEDLGSNNGTFVNGQPVTDSTRLWPGQKIQVGAATLELRRLKVEADPDVTLPPAEAAVQRLLPEELLRERRYDIAGQVAQGGMGAILEAQEAAIERRVAMKVMLHTWKEEDVARFVAEAKITGQLEHPNIVPVHELGVDENGQVFYTMKFVRGITLKRVLDLMATGVPETLVKYPLATLLTIFQKACDAVAFAHAKGVIHRDLKPENIMLGDFGEVLVMDWGLAKVLPKHPTSNEALARSAVRSVAGVSGSTQAGTIMGTPQYMSPEQANGEVATLDARTDIYALGAILFHLLELRPPVTGATVEEVLEKVRRGEVGSLVGQAPRLPAGRPAAGGAPALQRDIPDSLVAVVRKAMGLDRETRYATVPELQAEIAAYQAGFATAAENASLFKQSVLLIKRHKGIFTTAAAAWAIITALAVWFVLNLNTERRRAEAGEATATREQRRAEESLRQLQFRKAIEALDAGKPRDGLVWLAALLRDQPDHPTAGSLILSTLSHHSFILPVAAPMLVDANNPYTSAEPRFSPDGRLLVFSHSLPGRLWDPRSGQPAGPPLSRGRHAFFLTDGRRAVIGGNLVDEPEKDIKEVAVWDTITGKKIKVLPHEARVTAMILSADRSRLVTATQKGRISLWNTTTLEKDGDDFDAREPSTTFLSCSADGKWLVAKAWSGKGQLWDLTRKEGRSVPVSEFPGDFRTVFDPAGRGYFIIAQKWWRLMSFDGVPLAQGRNPALMGYDAITVSADGSRLLPLCILQNTVRLWSVTAGQPIGTPLTHGAELRHADFGPNDWRVFTEASNLKVALWSGRDGQPLAPFTFIPSAAGSTYTPAFSPIEDLIAMRGHQSRLPVCDIRHRAETPRAILPADASCRSALSPDGQWLAATASDTKVCLFDAATGARKAELGPSAGGSYLGAPTFSADSRLLACPVGRCRLKVWEIPSGQLRGEFDFGEDPPGPQILGALSRDGTLLAATGNNTSDVVVWNTGKPTAQPPRPRERGIARFLKFSPDGSLLAHGLIVGPRPFRVLDAATQQPLWHITQQAIDADFSPTEPWLALALNQAGVQLYDRITGAVHGPRLQHGSNVSIVRFSPDGQRLATAAVDHSVRLWDVAAGAASGEPMRHGSSITSIAFTPDGERLATGTRDGHLRLWDVKTGQPLTVALAHVGPVQDLAFTPDGRRLHALIRASHIRLYDVPPAAPLPTPLWLADLAEAVAVQRIGADGEMTDVGVPDFWPTRERLLAESGEDPFWGRWLRWFCADPATRTISAFSDRKTSEALDALVASNKRDALEVALLHRPRDPAIMSALAKIIRDAGKADPTMKADADFLEALATLRRKMPAAHKR